MKKVPFSLVFIVICLPGIHAASYAQDLPNTTRQQLLEENAALKRQVEQLSEIVEGTAHPINLGRTSLAAVTASSVNGSRTIDNQFYGARNAFDDGDNWINNLNYTYWLASGGAGNWVEVRFDNPITVKYILVESGPPFTTTFSFHKGGEETSPAATDRLDLKRPLHGVRRVRLTFGGGRGNTRVHEIRIMGFPPPDAKYEVGRPRMLLDARTARLLAVDRFEQWRNSLGRGVAPKTEENADRYVTTFRHLETGVDLFRVTVWKKTSKVETEVLAKWAPTRDSDAGEAQAPSQPGPQDSSATELRRVETAATAGSSTAPVSRAPARIRKVNHQWTPDEKAKVERFEKDGRTDPDALVLLGDHHFLQCGGDQVGALYEAALKLDPDHVRANLGMGEWHALHRRYDEAIPYLNRVLQLAEKDSPEAKQAAGVLKVVRYHLDHGKRKP